MTREKEQEKSVDFKGGSLPEDKHRVNTDRIADALCITLAARIFFAIIIHSRGEFDECIRSHTEHYPRSKCNVMCKFLLHRLTV